MKDKQGKKPNILFRLLAFLVTLALILGAVTLVVYRDKLNFDAVRRYFTYRSLERSDSGQAESFSIDGDAGDSFSAAGDCLLLASLSGIHLYSGSGTEYISEQATLAHPIVSSAGEWSLVYDAGGQDLFVLRDRELIYHRVLPSGKTLLSARINSSGYVAVTTQETGYKGSAIVYTPENAPLLQLKLSSSFLIDAMVTQDNASLSAVTVGQSSSGFECALSLYSLSRTQEDTQPDAVSSLGSAIVLDLDEDGAGLWTLGDNSAALTAKDGTPIGSYSYSGRFLKEYSLGGEGFAVLLLGKYRAGTLSDLVVMDQNGASSAVLSVSDQVFSLSAAGRYIAVLTADRLDIYTSDLTPYASLDGTQGARKVLMRSDGTALLISEEAARLYIPS